VNADSGSSARRVNTGRWVAAGFVLAFAVSVFTVIYTGLNVEASRADFDGGFRALEMRVAEQREARFIIESEVADADAILELAFPDFLEPVGPGGGAPWQRRVAIVPGNNEVAVELRAVAPGRGYVEARVFGAEAIGRDSVFVTATAAGDDQ
jgi:hypothetical protein